MILPQSYQHRQILLGAPTSPETTALDRVDLMGNIPGLRCPTCASQGKEVWVIPGRRCGYCGTPVG